MTDNESSGVATKFCTECGKECVGGERYRYGAEGVLCGDCLDKQAAKTQVCPNCGHEIEDGSECVGLLLTPVGSDERQRQNALETLVIVCSNCRILFFDEYHYKVMQGIKR